MKPLAARLTRGLNLGSLVISSDNSGAALVRITGIKHGKGRRGRQMSAALGDWVKVSVRKGLPEMKGKVFDAIVIRQRMPYRRNTGERICFTDNAVVLLKDEKGNPKGTQVKGPVPREIMERWKSVGKLAQSVV